VFVNDINYIKQKLTSFLCKIFGHPQWQKP
jgi:hypothetical protein